MADNSNLDRIENGNGEWTEFSTSGGVTGNLYTEDGTLQGNRVVTGNSKNLTVTGVGTLTYVGTLVYVTGGSGGLELKTENGGTLLVSSNADLNVTAAAASAINITKAGAGDVNITQNGNGDVNIASAGGAVNINSGDVISIKANTGGVDFNNEVLSNVGDAQNNTDAANFGLVKGQSGAASPVGSVTPRYYGDIYINTTDSGVWIANGLANTNWVNVG